MARGLLRKPKRAPRSQVDFTLGKSHADGFHQHATTRARFAANIRAITIVHDPGYRNDIYLAAPAQRLTTLTMLLHALTNLGIMAACTSRDPHNQHMIDFVADQRHARGCALDARRFAERMK
jgi:hypothetical protein